MFSFYINHIELHRPLVFFLLGYYLLTLRVMQCCVMCVLHISGDRQDCGCTCVWWSVRMVLIYVYGWVYFLFRFWVVLSVTCVCLCLCVYAHIVTCFGICWPPLLLCHLFCFLALLNNAAPEHWATITALTPQLTSSSEDRLYSNVRYEGWGRTLRKNFKDHQNRGDNLTWIISIVII